MTLPRKAIVYLATGCLLVACSGEVLPTGVAIPSTSDNSTTLVVRPEPNSPFVLARLPTYDHSMQAVHPDVIHFDQPWMGWEYWMAFTPFPGGAVSFENPSIAVSHNGLNWHVPDGLTNPLVPAPATGYNSDPDLSFDRERGELVLIYRTVASGYNQISEMRSSDGVHWGRPARLFRRRNHGIVSPAMVLAPDGGARIWYVDAGSASCDKRVTHVKMQSAKTPDALRDPGLERPWSKPVGVTMAQPGYNIWHLDVSWIEARNEYWAVYSAYPGTSCTTQELFFARSSDGVNWQTYAIPFVRHGDLPWTSGSMYRASVLFDAASGTIRFFTSSRSRGEEWRIGTMSYNLATFLTVLGYGQPASFMATGPAGSPTADIEP
jgi:hypothetical protein